jgi:hypothetical protein
LSPARNYVASKRVVNNVVAMRSASIRATKGIAIERGDHVQTRLLDEVIVMVLSFRRKESWVDSVLDQSSGLSEIILIYYRYACCFVLCEINSSMVVSGLC